MIKDTLFSLPSRFLPDGAQPCRTHLPAPVRQGSVYPGPVCPPPIRLLPIRLLIVDDSMVMRSIIARMFEDSPDIDVAAMVPTAEDAWRWLRDHQADIILLDHEMPGQSGLEALPRILKAARGAPVIMLSSHYCDGADLAAKARLAGASETVPKPHRIGAVPDLADHLARMFHRLTSGGNGVPVPDDGYEMKAMPDDFRPACIGIGASTGGIHILAEIFAVVERKPGVPVFITQHLPASFTDGYADQVRRMTDLPVSVACDGQMVEPDHIYIAPGHASLCCRWTGRANGRALQIALVRGRDPATLAMPSVNRMLASMAECFGPRAMGIILSGMGRDGLLGAQKMVDAGAVMLAQDRASSVIWGMPGAVVRSGLASVITSPSGLAHYINRGGVPVARPERGRLCHG